MNLSEKEFVEKVFAIEDKFEIFKTVVLDCFIMMLIFIVAAIAEISFMYFAFTFGFATLFSAYLIVEAGYFPVMNFRREYMPSYSEDELGFIEKCEPMNPFATSNFVKYEHLFIG